MGKNCLRSDPMKQGGKSGERLGKELWNEKGKMGVDLIKIYFVHE